MLLIGKSTSKAKRMNDKSDVKDAITIQYKILDGVYLFVVAFLLGFSVGLATGIIHFDIHRPRG